MATHRGGSNPRDDQPQIAIEWIPELAPCVEALISRQRSSPDDETRQIVAKTGGLVVLKVIGGDFVLMPTGRVYCHDQDDGNVVEESDPMWRASALIQAGRRFPELSELIARPDGARPCAWCGGKGFVLMDTFICEKCLGWGGEAPDRESASPTPQADSDLLVGKRQPESDAAVPRPGEVMDLSENSDLDELLRGLQHPWSDVAQDAQDWLVRKYGAAAIPQVLSLMPQLNVFSKRCAVELIQHCRREEVQAILDPPVGEALIPFLEDDDPVVREWVADALGWLRERAAVPAIERARERAAKAGVELDWTEAMSYRRALSDLGARQPVEPPLVEKRKLVEPNGWECWPCLDLDKSIEALADAEQAVLFFQVWKRGRLRPEGREYFAVHDAPTYALDLHRPWGDLVRESRQMAVVAARAIKKPKRHVATIEWIQESDRL